MTYMSRVKKGLFLSKSRLPVADRAKMVFDPESRSFGISEDSKKYRQQKMSR